MQEMADWLKALGLTEYARAFAENGIDVSVLPRLTDQDLKDIGVLLGHRRKILAAVAELPRRFAGRIQASFSADRGKGPPNDQISPTVGAGRAATDRSHRGERRHVSVTFCDLVDCSAADSGGIP
jgi:hypothetical protein